MQTTTRRGRPPEADAHEVARIALDLFERHGFDHVTRDQIAAASGVSRRTLFRLFPSKSDLVWDGIEDVLTLVQPRVARRGAGRSVHALMRTVIEPVLRIIENPAAAAIARRRLRLMTHAPVLLHHPALRELEAALGQMLQTHAAAAGIAATLMARAMVSTLFGALLWWSEQDTSMSALDVARAALRSVALLERRRDHAT